MIDKFRYFLKTPEIKKFFRYLRLFLNGIAGIGIELVYPVVVFLISSIVCFLFFLSIYIKK